MQSECNALEWQFDNSVNGIVSSICQNKTALMCAAVWQFGLFYVIRWMLNVRTENGNSWDFTVSRVSVSRSNVISICFFSMPIINIITHKPQIVRRLRLCVRIYFYLLVEVPSICLGFDLPFAIQNYRMLLLLFSFSVDFFRFPSFVAVECWHNDICFDYWRTCVHIHHLHKTVP